MCRRSQLYDLDFKADYNRKMNKDIRCKIVCDWILILILGLVRRIEFEIEEKDIVGFIVLIWCLVLKHSGSNERDR